MTKTQLPTHVAFIVDGNRRWAKAHKLEAIAGHRKVAMQVFDDLVFHAVKRGIPYLTFWVFSTENWERGDSFVKPLMNLFREVIIRDYTPFDQAGIRLNTIGSLDGFPADIVKMIHKRQEASKKNSKLVVTIALNYGGRDELLRAIKKLVKSGHYSLNNIDNITESEFSQFLDTHDLPDPDLIIRTSGEQRLSGFLPWQSVYSELAFPKTLFPDFTPTEFDLILEDFSKRERRFGGNLRQTLNSKP